MPYDAFMSSCSEDKKIADAVLPLLDKPYAIQKATELKQAVGAELALIDITSEIIPGVELEKMGFAVRTTDRALLQELNQQLKATAAARDGVLSKSIPGW